VEWAHRLLEAADLRSSGTRYEAMWRRILLAFIPIGALAFLVGLALEVPSGQATGFDLVLYPLMGGFLLLLEAVLAFGRRTLPLVVMTIIVGASSFFFLKLGWLLFLAPAGTDVQAQFTETLFWIPVVYLLSFILEEGRLGQLAVRAFTAGVLLLAGVYTVPGAIAGAVDWGVAYALIELNLANTVLLVLTSVFIQFKESYTRTRARMEEAERQAYHDALTGLANRLRLDDELERRLDRARSSGGRVAMLYLDVDGFKVVNDTLGHEAGDELLRSVSRRLQDELGPDDVMARISGDEFVIILGDVESPQAAMFAARKLQAALVKPFDLHDLSHHVTASIGICLYPDDAPDGPTLLRHADSAMYRVKRSGKNGVQRYRADSDALVERQRSLERELRTGLSADDGQLTVVYQSIHDLETGELRKVEALARWYHPKWGHVPPHEFIPIAERSGLIVSLGERVLREACRQAKAWEALSGQGVVVSVNVSAMQFAHPGFFRTVEAALEDHALLPELLEIELTEGIVMHGVDHVTETLQRLQRLGVRIAIDDFGTGYSSFAYLRDLPIDTVKIDKSFVKDLGSPLHAPHFALALVEAITHVAKHLDLVIVAEGIETEAQRRVLRDLGCQLGQGFLFSRPLPAAEVQPSLPLTPGKPRPVRDTLVN
jgi:diguanylate cyclase (GGDEF)-like protein